MNRFSIEELKLANELCFPDTFKKLMTEALGERAVEDLDWILYDFKCHGNDLIRWVFKFSRADFSRNPWLKIAIDKLISELIQS